MDMASLAIWLDVRTLPAWDSATAMETVRGHLDAIWSRDRDAVLANIEAAGAHEFLEDPTHG